MPAVGVHVLRVNRSLVILDLAVWRGGAKEERDGRRETSTDKDKEIDAGTEKSLVAKIIPSTLNESAQGACQLIN